MKPKDYEVIYKFTVASTVPFSSTLNWNAEPIGELIRCKDCKWLDRDVTSIGTFLTCNAVSNGGTKFFPEDDKWFCPKAERKEE